MLAWEADLDERRAEGTKRRSGPGGLRRRLAGLLFRLSRLLAFLACGLRVEVGRSGRPGEGLVLDDALVALRVDDGEEVAIGGVFLGLAVGPQRIGERRLAGRPADRLGEVEIGKPDHHHPRPAGREAPCGRPAFLPRRLLGAQLAGAGERLLRQLVAAEPRALLGLREADALRRTVLGRCRAGEGEEGGES